MSKRSSQLAFVFPGQGSQTLGMLSEHALKQPIIRETFAEASEVLGFDLWSLAQVGPESDLNKTANTQPALLASAVALWRLWQNQTDILPSVMSGHSFGEYAAWVCANSIDFAEGLKLVRLRGELMQQAVPQGAGTMAVILGLEDKLVEEICEQYNKEGCVSAANYNAPGQIVIAGDAATVEKASQEAVHAGAKRVVPVAISVPSHCELMIPAAQEFARALEDIEIKTPEIAVVNNVAAEIETDPQKIKEALKKQLYNPVLWSKGVEKMFSMGVTTILECGPGKVLTGLNKRIERSLKVQSLGEPDGFQQSLEWMEELQHQECI